MDIVERLNEMIGKGEYYEPEFIQAKDEIERLREALKFYAEEHFPASKGPWGMDIVERLRKRTFTPDFPPLTAETEPDLHCHDAADEIERLRNENEQLGWDAALAVKRGFDLNDAYQEIERLREALDRIAVWDDGELGPHMDEPGSASIARAALKGDE